MIDILQYLPPRTRKSPSGWHTFNCPACVHVGETQDKRKRAGMIFDGDDWSFSCFNCNYKARFVNGQQLSLKARNLLKWMGVPEDVIKKINFDSLKNKKIYDIANSRADEQEQIVQKNVFFTKVELPTTARNIMSCDKWAVDYIEQERGLNYHDYPFKITPQEQGRHKHRIMIPYLYAGEVVGWTSRYLDNRKPKYVNEHTSPGFVFGMDMQKPDWDFLIVVEGVFCAISISGVAVLHNEMSEQQLALIRRQGKEVIVVPDQDKAGIVLAEQALAAGFSISIPDWPAHVTDVNDAVKEFGKIGALISIVAAKTANKVRARVLINNLARRRKIKLDDRVYVPNTKTIS